MTKIIGAAETMAWSSKYVAIWSCHLIIFLWYRILVLSRGLEVICLSITVLWITYYTAERLLVLTQETLFPRLLMPSALHRCSTDEDGSLWRSLSLHSNMFLRHCLPLQSKYPSLFGFKQFYKVTEFSVHAYIPSKRRSEIGIPTFFSISWLFPASEIFRICVGGRVPGHCVQGE